MIRQIYQNHRVSDCHPIRTVYYRTLFSIKRDNEIFEYSGMLSKSTTPFRYYRHVKITNWYKNETTLFNSNFECIDMETIMCVAFYKVNEV